MSAERVADNHFDLGVHASHFFACPPCDGIINLVVESKGNLFARHEYEKPELREKA